MALEKTIAERTAALKKAGDDVTAAAQGVLAARAKVSPVRDVVRHKEKIALDARRKMAETRSVAETHLKHHKLLESLVRCQTLQKQLAESDRATPRWETRLSAARTQSGRARDRGSA